MSFAISGLDEVIVTIHKFASDLRAKIASRSIWEESKSGLKLSESEGNLEEGCCARCDHAPYCVNIAKEEKRQEDVFLEEEFEWCDKAVERELLLRWDIMIN